MEFEFMHPEGAPGHIQAALGDAGFKAFLETQEANTQANSMISAGHGAYEFARAERAKAQAEFIKISGAVGALAALPVIVWLWKWAVGA